METVSIERMDRTSRPDLQANLSSKSPNPKYFFGRQIHYNRTDGRKACDNEGDAENDDTVNEYQKNQELKEKTKMCSICHSTVRHKGFEKSVSYNQDHFLCQRCTKHYATQSVIAQTSYVLSNNESHHPTSTRSWVSTNGRSVENCRTESHASPGIQMPNNNEDMRDHRLQRRFRIAEQLRTDLYIDLDMAQSNEVDDIKGQSFNYCNEMRTHSNELMVSKMRITNEMTVECSRRPIRCPRLDCAVNVAFSALTHHFLFDHPEVPILRVEPGVLSTLIISFASLTSDSSHCLAVLLVSSKLTSSVSRPFHGNQIHPKYRDRLPLPVLAARLHCTNNYTTHDNANGKTEGNAEGDIIITWIAGLDITNVGDLHCTIQAVDNLDGVGIRSLSYSGPINSLRIAQRPREVFSTGDCLILHKGLLNHLTTNSATLNINVIVH